MLAHKEGLGQLRVTKKNLKPWAYAWHPQVNKGSNTYSDTCRIPATQIINVLRKLNIIVMNQLTSS